jgi:hypothetical protein
MRFSAAITPADSHPALPPPTIIIVEILSSISRLVSHKSAASFHSVVSDKGLQDLSCNVKLGVA